jgi:hypothetical protein
MRKGLNWAFFAVMAVTPCAYFAAKIFRQFGIYRAQWRLLSRVRNNTGMSASTR